jgi:hypothetical protein
MPCDPKCNLPFPSFSAIIFFFSAATAQLLAQSETWEPKLVARDEKHTRSVLFETGNFLFSLRIRLFCLCFLANVRWC